MTFFDGEIISEKHPFLTRKWDADEDVDKKHWVTFSSSSQPLSISEHFPTRGCVNVKLYFHWLDKTFQKHTLDFFLNSRVAYLLIYFQSKFLAFYQYAKTFNSDTFDYEELNRTDYVFMRWKEHFLVPDHTIKVSTHHRIK